MRHADRRHTLSLMHVAEAALHHTHTRCDGHKQPLNSRARHTHTSLGCGGSLMFVRFC